MGEEEEHKGKQGSSRFSDIKKRGRRKRCLDNSCEERKKEGRKRLAKMSNEVSSTRLTLDDGLSEVGGVAVSG